MHMFTVEMLTSFGEMKSSSRHYVTSYYLKSALQFVILVARYFAHLPFLHELGEFLSVNSRAAEWWEHFWVVYCHKLRI